MAVRLTPTRVTLARGLTMALLAVLAACSTPTDQSERETVVRAPLAPLVTGPIDGIYRGRTDLVSATGPGCPGGSRGLLEIGDRMVLFPYNADLTFISPISTAGTIQARAGGYAFEGTLRDGHLEATVTGAGCSTHLSFERVAFF